MSKFSKCPQVRIHLICTVIVQICIELLVPRWLTFLKSTYDYFKMWQEFRSNFSRMCDKFSAKFSGRNFADELYWIPSIWLEYDSWQGRRKVRKIQGGTYIVMWWVLSVPLVEIGLTGLPKTGGMVPQRPPRIQQPCTVTAYSKIGHCQFHPKNDRQIVRHTHPKIICFHHMIHNEVNSILKEHDSFFVYRFTRILWNIDIYLFK